LVSTLGHALIDAGRRELFIRCSDLVQRLQAARCDLRLPQELAGLDRFDLLSLDDSSHVRRDPAKTSVLFELISERYERKSLAITANTPFSQWGKPAMTLAAVDRLVHRRLPAKPEQIRPLPLNFACKTALSSFDAPRAACSGHARTNQRWMTGPALSPPFPYRSSRPLPARCLIIGF